jgi:plasmid stability protein
MSEPATQPMPVSVVFPDDLRARLVATAREHERSVSAEIRLAVREHLAATNNKEHDGNAH